MVCLYYTKYQFTNGIHKSIFYGLYTSFCPIYFAAVFSIFHILKRDKFEFQRKAKRNFEPMFCVLLSLVCSDSSSSSKEPEMIVERGPYEFKDMYEDFWSEIKEAEVAILACTNTLPQDNNANQHKEIIENAKCLTIRRIELMSLLVDTLKIIGSAPEEKLGNVLFSGIIEINPLKLCLIDVWKRINNKTASCEEELKELGLNELKEHEERIHKPEDHEKMLHTLEYKVSYEISVLCSIIKTYNNNHTKEFTLDYEEKRIFILDKIKLIDLFFNAYKVCIDDNLEGEPFNC